jgi:hypothetical protein
MAASPPCARLSNRCGSSATPSIAPHQVTVVDAFLGSGPTLIAAERDRRHRHAVEIDPLYVDARSDDGRPTRAMPLLTPSPATHDDISRTSGDEA